MPGFYRLPSGRTNPTFLCRSCSKPCEAECTHRLSRVLFAQRSHRQDWDLLTLTESLSEDQTMHSILACFPP
eukprot:89881-Hanusia_phi.AAC.1